MGKTNKWATSSAPKGATSSQPRTGPERVSRICFGGEILTDSSTPLSSMPVKLWRMGFANGFENPFHHRNESTAAGSHRYSASAMKVLVWLFLTTQP